MDHLGFKTAAGVDTEAGTGAPFPIALYGTQTSAGDTAVKAITATGQICVAPLTQTAVADAQANAYVAVAGNGTTGALGVAGMAYNGATFDRLRTNIEGTALASAARTSTTSSSDIVNYNGSTLRVFINTTASSTPSTTVSIEVKDPISGTYTSLLTSAAIAANGHVVMVVGPGVTAAANLAASNIVPRTFRVTATHGNANSHTYSIGYSLNL